MNQQLGLNKIETRGAHSLALLFALRMMGLFMLMPVLAVHGQHLIGANPLWIGFAIGVYGLTQALFQLPMGWLSDRFGRKPIIISGLVLFAIGAVIAALADSIYGVVLGRALQGMGAIASAVMALAADLSRETQRAKVMAFIGVSIGLSFAASLVLGPLVTSYLGLSGLFWLTAGFALFGIAVVIFMVPSVLSAAPKSEVQAKPLQMLKLLRHPQLLRLDAGVFILHLCMTGLFVSLPLRLVDSGLALNSHWLLYLPTILVSFVLMIPLLIIAAKRNQNRGFFMFGIGLLIIANLLMLLSESNIWVLAVVVLVFFTGFNYLEASLPALLSNMAPSGNKGAALGLFSSSQFLGAFVGGTGAGWLQLQQGNTAVSLACLALLLLWLCLSVGMRAPAGLKSYALSITSDDDKALLLAKLSALPGVVEVAVVINERTAYIKVKTKQFELSQAQDIVKPKQA